jgi:putative spermidine/putrescine transport system permease protein
LDVKGALSLANYVEVLTSRANASALINTLMIAIASTVLALAICLPAALYVEGFGTRPARKHPIMAAILAVPLSLPGIVIGFFVILLFGLTGAVPYLIEWVTSARGPVIAYTFWGLLIGYLYFQIPRMMLVLRSAAAAVSEDALDAARSLGASEARVFLYAVVPMMRHAIISACALSLSTAIGAFGTAATLSRGYRVSALEIAAAFTDSFEPNLAAAMSIVLTLIGALLLIAVNGLATDKKRKRSHGVSR